MDQNLAFIDYTKCTSCGKCATVCPKHLITDAGLTAPVLEQEHSASGGTFFRRGNTME